MKINRDTGQVEITPISTIVEKLMAYYQLDRLRFAEKYRVEPSQVTRWLNNGQQPKTEVYLRLRMEYDKIKDKELPLFQMIS